VAVVSQEPRELM